MRVAVIRYPGSNCDQDALFALRDDLKVGADYVWHQDTSLAGFDAVFIPGGFTYGDYLRCGAMAARAPIMAEVQRFIAEGRPVLGVCNGFQILCEAGLLPGALLPNEDQKFLCRTVYLRAETRRSLWTQGVSKPMAVPIAHGDGRYICDADTMARLLDTDSIAFRYVNPEGLLDPEWNFNGSQDAIAGVLNERGNALGMMPHPERATSVRRGHIDGRMVLNAFNLVNV